MCMYVCVCVSVCACTCIAFSNVYSLSLSLSLSVSLDFDIPMLYVVSSTVVLQRNQATSVSCSVQPSAIKGVGCGGGEVSTGLTMKWTIQVSEGEGIREEGGREGERVEGEGGGREGGGEGGGRGRREGGWMHS